MNVSLGPGGEVPFLLTSQISDILQDHSRYQYNLPLWKRYIIWMYTVGSGSVNRYLIGNPVEDNLLFWVYWFFKYYTYDFKLIGQTFQKYLRFFTDPGSFQKLSLPEGRKIADAVLRDYARTLESIILQAPPTLEPITVYKSSTKYPGLPEHLKEHHEIVFQKPFNSTTYNPQLNFGMFLPENPKCCMFSITIPKGSRVLFLAAGLSAYPFEREVLLPFGVKFDITKIDEHPVNFIAVEDQQLIKTQQKPYSIGEMYRVSPECLSKIQTRLIQTYHAVLVE